MNAQHSDLPEFCYVFVDGVPGRRIGLVRHGESGYYPTSLDFAYAPDEEVQEQVRQLNSRHGITPEQAERMHAGSMFGWDKPLARGQTGAIPC